MLSRHIRTKSCMCLNKEIKIVILLHSVRISLLFYKATVCPGGGIGRRATLRG